MTAPMTEVKKQRMIRRVREAHRRREERRLMNASQQAIDGYQEEAEGRDEPLLRFRCSVNTSAIVEARTMEEAAMGFLASWLDPDDVLCEELEEAPGHD